jgi:hypothetical protein
MRAPRIRRCARGETEDAGPVGETMLGKLALIRLKQRTEIGRHLRKRVRLYLL